MKKLAAARAAVMLLVVSASLAMAGVVAPVPAHAAVETYSASSVVEVHASPADTADVLGVLAKDAHVLPTAAASAGWLPISYAATTGYVDQSKVTVDKSATAVVTTGPAGKKLAMAPVNMRESASLDAAILTVLDKNTVVRVTGLTSGGFTQISYDGKTRWIYTQFLSVITDTTPDVVAQFTTTAKLALRVTASTTARNQKTISKARKVGGTGVHSGTFSQVVYKGKTGWVLTGYLKAAKRTPAKLVLPLRKSTRYVLATGTVLRATADAAGEQLATLNAATALRTTGSKKTTFTAVIWNGSIAWVATVALASRKPTVVGASADVGDLGSDSLNKLEPYAKAAVLAVRAAFPEIRTIYGWRSSSAYSGDHPAGRATDNMIPDYKNNKALGDAVAAWAIAHGKELHISYLIWRQRSYTLSRGTWKDMADRGSDTANHMNHVHLSFEPS